MPCVGDRVKSSATTHSSWQEVVTFDVMKMPSLFRIDAISVVDVTGADAAVIVHNVTTNEVKKLSVGEGRETFVTDVRGKTIGHCFLYRLEDGFRLIGAGGQSDRIVAHVDRYTIREDAVPLNRDKDFLGLVFAPHQASRWMIDWDTDSHPIGHGTVSIGKAQGLRYRTRWLGESTDVVLIPQNDIANLESWIVDQGVDVGDETAFHAARTAVGFPWYGIDLTDANLPQEADRDDLAISFTKGCYLGQETVARLDALGQVQKKLVRWSIRGAVPEKDAALIANEKTVGRLTSVAPVGPTDRIDPSAGDEESSDAIAIGFARRSHFEPSAIANGISSDGTEFIATVIGG